MSNQQPTSIFPLLLSLSLLIGMFLSYLPQLHKLHTQKSSTGLSPFYLFLGALCTSSTFLAAILEYQPALAQCPTPALACALTVTSIATLVVQLASLLAIFGLAATYSTTNRVKRLLMATGGYLCIGFIAVLATLSNETKRERTADVFGYTSVGMTCVMYLPQIYITWLAKKAGSLSILTLALQGPGSFVLVWTMLQVDGPTFATWGPYAIAGSMQIVLFIMCSYFHWKYPERVQLNVDDENHRSTEFSETGYGTGTRLLPDLKEDDEEEDQAKS